MSFTDSSMMDMDGGVGYTPPPEWQAAIDQTAPGLMTIFEQQNVTPTQDWITTAARVVSIVQMADWQRQLMRMQLDRASRGLPPLDASQYAPGVQIRAGLSPQMEKGLLIGGAFFLLWLFSKG